MCDPNPNPVDGKWYTLLQAQKRQNELVATMPTGTDWWWVDTNGNAVVFTTPRQQTKEEGSDK